MKFKTIFLFMLGLFLVFMLAFLENISITYSLSFDELFFLIKIAGGLVLVFSYPLFIMKLLDYLNNKNLEKWWEKGDVE